MVGVSLMGFDKLNGNYKFQGISGSSDSLNDTTENKPIDEKFNGRFVVEETVTPFIENLEPKVTAGKRIGEYDLATSKKNPLSTLLKNLIKKISCATSNAVGVLAKESSNYLATEDSAIEELKSENVVFQNELPTDENGTKRIRLSEMLSLDSIKARVMAEHEKQHLSRVKQTVLEPTLIGNGFKVPISDGKYLSVPTSDVYIGPDNGEGIVTSFSSGVDEQFVKFANGENAIIHKDGRYIIVNSMEVVKGFKDRWFGVVGDQQFTGDSGSIGVIHDGTVYFVSTELGEQVKQMPGKNLLVCIDGRVKELGGKWGEECGFFDKAYYFTSSGKPKIIPWEGGDDLQRGLDILNKFNSPEEARLALRGLFQSEGAREVLFRGDGYLINREAVLEFIDLYSNAIAMESKEKEALSRTHKKRREKKKKQRLSAINEVKTFVNGLNPSSAEYEHMLFCSVQMLGRIRESSMVKKHRMPLPYSFSLLQAGWKDQPLKMVKLTTELLSSPERSFEVDTQVPGHKRLFKVPETYSVGDYVESSVDSLMIAALYNVKSTGNEESTRPQDGMLARYLGFTVKQSKGVSSLHKQKEKRDEALLSDLSKASKSKVNILATIKGHLEDFVNKYAYQNDFFSGKQSKVVKYASPKESFKSDIDSLDKGNPILITKFERKEESGNNIVLLKILTKDGHVMNLKMKQKEFLQHFDPTSCLLISLNKDKEFKSFENLDNNVIY